MNKEDVFSRLVIFTVEGYLDDIHPESTYNYEFLLKIRTGIRMFMKGHRFSMDEYKLIMGLSESKALKDRAKDLVDRTLYALELLLIYIEEIPKAERAYIGMSDAKIKSGKSKFVLDMLKLRQKEAEKHAQVKEIATDSRLSAKWYFDYCKKEIL